MGPDLSKRHGSERVRPLIQLDRGTPFIMGERECAPVRPSHHGLIELNTGGLKLLGELVQVLHIESNVIEHPSLGGNGRRVGLGKGQVHPWKVDRLEAAAHAGPAAEVLAVPSLYGRNRRFRQIKMHMMMF